MAEYCNQCCDFLQFPRADWGLDSLCDEGETATVICECCGPTEVDHLGNCLQSHIKNDDGFLEHFFPEECACSAPNLDSSARCSLCGGLRMETR